MATQAKRKRSSGARDIAQALIARAPRERQLATFERRLRRLAKLLRTAADRVDLAATYAGDGAEITAEEITLRGRASGKRTAVSLADEVVRNLSSLRWQR